jgi:dTDP-4-amino-4,6-dideoxygalactose transaminase
MIAAVQKSRRSEPRNAALPGQDTQLSATPVRAEDRFLVFGAPAIGEEEIREVVDSLESGWLGTGPKVARFEQDFAAYKGVSHAAALNSCTAALHLSVLALQSEPGDEVITSPLTFAATVNAIIHAGASPILADIDPTTMNIDPDEVRRQITDRTRAILPVHFGGRPCEMDALAQIAEEHGLRIIEDCAHAIETEYQGQPAGTFGDFGCFSFYVTKNVITGEGGMVITRSEQDLARIKVLALHGLSKDAWKRFSDEGYRHYEVVASGFKYNMMDIQAAIGIHQLARVEQNWERRRQIWNRYDEAFRDLPITTPAAPAPRTRHACHLYTILVDEAATGISRDAFLEGMTAQNVGVGVHYLSVAEHPFYRESFGWQATDYPHAMQIGRQTVSLPLSAGLEDDDVADVIEAVERVIGS